MSAIVNYFMVHTTEHGLEQQQFITLGAAQQFARTLQRQAAYRHDPVYITLLQTTSSGGWLTVHENKPVETIQPQAQEAPTT